MTSSPEATEPDANPVRVTVIPLAVPAAGDFEPPVPTAVVAPSALMGSDPVTAVEQPSAVHPLAAGRHGQTRTRHRLHDPWTYAAVGTFIAVFATVFDVLLVTLGTTNTKLLTAGAIAAGCGLALVIASAATLRRHARSSTGDPA